MYVCMLYTYNVSYTIISNRYHRYVLLLHVYYRYYMQVLQVLQVLQVRVCHTCMYATGSTAAIGILMYFILLINVLV